MPQKSDQQLTFIPRGGERGYFLNLTVENKVPRGCLTPSYSQQVEQLYT